MITQLFSKSSSTDTKLGIDLVLCPLRPLLPRVRVHHLVSFLHLRIFLLGLQIVVTLLFLKPSHLLPYHLLNLQKSLLKLIKMSQMEILMRTMFWALRKLIFQKKPLSQLMTLLYLVITERLSLNQLRFLETLPLICRITVMLVLPFRDLYDHQSEGNELFPSRQVVGRYLPMFPPCQLMVCPFIPRKRLTSGSM